MALPQKKSKDTLFRAAFTAAVVVTVAALAVTGIAFLATTPATPPASSSPAGSSSPAKPNPVARSNRPAPPKANPLAPVTLAPPPGAPGAPANNTPAPIAIADGNLKVGDPATADPTEFALHPSHFADPTRLVKKIGLATIPLDDTPPTPPTQSSELRTQNSVYAEAVRLEKARAFTMSMCQGLDGRIWIGSENTQPGDGTGGVQVWDPSKPPLEAFTQFTTKNGLGDDNCYAIACDRLGRIWAGTGSHGISVFNGSKWYNYDQFSGPLGERIRAITISPTDGAVWIATNRGLARYDTNQDEWNYFARYNGLPSEQTCSIAFDTLGNAYVGTLSEGILIGSQKDKFQTWQQVRIGSGSDGERDAINQVVARGKSDIFVATARGLLYSPDNGATWQLVTADQIGAATFEDYCTCIIADTENEIWVGHRSGGCQRIGEKSTVTLLDGEYVTAISTEKNGGFMAATYGSGLQVGKTVKSSTLAHTNGRAPLPKSIPFPLRATPLSKADLDGILDRISNTPPTKTDVVYLGDDYSTKGDWTGRYGRQHATLFAASSPYDDVYQGTREKGYTVLTSIGANARSGDVIRRWLADVRTEDRRALWVPDRGARRQSSLDDHGEAYTESSTGPDIRITVRIPNGIHRLSLYFVNNDGHQGRNRLRDMLVSVLPTRTDGANVRNLPGATTRITQFWGGVYEQFLVRGGKEYDIYIRRNGLNAIISGLFVDLMPWPEHKPGAPRYDTGNLPDEPLSSMGTFLYRAPKASSSANIDSLHAKSAAMLGEQVQARMNAGDAQYSALFIQCYRAAEEAGAPANLLENWRWHLPLWTENDRRSFDSAIAQGFQSFLNVQSEKTRDLILKGR